MANQIMSMHKLKKLLKLILEGKSGRQISRLTSMSRNSFDKYKFVFDAHPLSYKELLQLSDKELYSILLPASTGKPTHQELYGMFPQMEKSLSRVGVTKFLLWEQYKQNYPDGVQYSQFCEHFSRYLKSHQISYVFDHKAGDKLMVDFAGKKLHLTDADTGELIPVEFFVGILPCSGYTYAETCISQQSADFLGCLGNCMTYIGGVPQAIVTDNLKPAVIRASKYDPELNKSMADFAEHYDTAILPTRARKPQDKALVESAVNILYTRVYAPLHDRLFHSLTQLNQAIKELLDKHNHMLFQKKEYSRKQQFESIEQQTLKPLPKTFFELRKYQQATAHPNCHVLLSEDKHHYSLPYQYVGKKVSISYTNKSVEIYFKYERIAIHQRNRAFHKYTTIDAQLHPKHQYYKRWNKDYFIEQGTNIGSNTHLLMEQIFMGCKHPEQGFKLCQGVLNLASKHGNIRLDKACGLCLQYEFISYRRLVHLLSIDFEKIILEKEPETQLSIFHENLRGDKYYK